LRLKRATRTTLARLALAVALCPAAGAQSPVAQESPGAASAPPNSSPAEPQLPPVPAVGAVASYEGLVVRSIDFPGLPPARAKRLLELIPQKAGAPLERERVRQSIQTLHATGRFAGVQAEAERTSDGQVRLLFRVRQNFFVGEIFVSGEPNPPAANQVVKAIDGAAWLFPFNR
jgi:outer membrane protein assembly factor BamA